LIAVGFVVYQIDLLMGGDTHGHGIGVLTKWNLAPDDELATHPITQKSQ